MYNLMLPTTFVWETQVKEKNNVQVNPRSKVLTQAQWRYVTSENNENNPYSDEKQNKKIMYKAKEKKKKHARTSENIWSNIMRYLKLTFII